MCVSRHKCDMWSELSSPTSGLCVCVCVCDYCECMYPQACVFFIFTCDMHMRHGRARCVWGTVQ